MTRIGLVTDSNSQFPEVLAQRHGVEIVPLTVTVDGVAHAEGVDLDADDFYGRWADGTAPTVTTAAPSPGAFAQAYAALAARGVDEILSIHIGSTISGTLNAARLAVDSAPVPVRLVDTGTASFGISCCVWEAAEAIAAGADSETAAAVAESLAPAVGNVFVVGALDIVRSGGRLAADATGPSGDAVPVLSLIDGQITPVGQAVGVDEAVEAMTSFVLAAGGPLRVAVGVADRGAAALWHALENRLATEDAVVDVIRYRIGPSVGVHTGPGTAGCFFWPPTR